MKLFSVILLSSFASVAFAFDWQGHRGARGLYPENTIGAMEEALKYPVTTLELDVVISKDMKVVVSHEPWMNEEMCMNPEGKRVEGKTYNLFKMTYEEIQKFDCGSLPHPRFPQQKKIVVGKPTLEKLLEATEKYLKDLNRTNVQYNIEIKSTIEDEKAGFQPNYEVFSDLVLREIKSKLNDNRYTIQSFDWRVLRYIHKKYPGVRLVALYEGPINSKKVLQELEISPAVFSPYYKELKKEIVEEFHALKIKVIPWTVNDVPSMLDMIGMGVDGIITDYPNLIEEVVSKKCGKGTNYFEDQCIKVPVHGMPSEVSPGWKCKPGYVQKRSSCVKINLPKHSHLLPDGKNWECDDGYTRYRSSCKK